MSKTLKDILIGDVIAKQIADAVNFGDTVPSLHEIYENAESKINTLFDLSTIPSIEYKSPTSVKAYNEEFTKILTWLRSTSKSLSDVIDEHQRLSKKYLAICNRINNEFSIFNAQFGTLLNYACKFVDTLHSKQSPSSNVSKIGPYITLPYYINAVSMYDGPIYVRATSTDTVIFSNIENTSAIPITEPISYRVQSLNKTIKVKISINLSKTQTNLLYIAFLNKIVGADIKLYCESKTVYECTADRKDILINVEPLNIDTISIDLTCDNPNVAKPYSIQIGNIQVFTNVQFSKYGIFESLTSPLGEAAAIDTVSLSHKNYGDISQTNVAQNISIATSPNTLFYSKIDKDSKIDISSYKFTQAVQLNRFPAMLEHEDISVSSSRRSNALISKAFFKISVPRSDKILWDINYEDAIVYYGLNKSYAVNVGSISALQDPYENWTKVGTYYKSMIVNYEDGVIVDIGRRTCKINGKDFTGRFTVPTGVSSIEVHMKDIDIKYGNKVENDRYNGIVNEQAVLDDPLYPFNFAYLFSGLPDYDAYASNILTDKLTEKEFTVDGTSSIFLNESVIPLSVEVTDSKGRPYNLQISKAPSTQGSFTIEPYRGRIKIRPMLDETGNIIDNGVKVRYRRSNSGIKPCGILFNRLLTFIPLKGMLSILASESSDSDIFFTVDGDRDQRYILIPQISHDTVTPGSISHAQVAFNTRSEQIYTSVKLELETINKYITPIVDNIYVVGE